MEHNSLEQNNDQLILDSKQTAWLISGLLLLLFFVFMAGYFWGKHQALEQFSHALDQESIADKIYSSLYCSYEGKTGVEIPEVESKPESEHTEHLPSCETCYAQLIGFGSKKTAQNYVDKLAKQGFGVEVKERTSVMGNGRLTTWYQVVTKPYTSREELAAVVAVLTKRELLRDVRIVTH